MLIGEFVKAVDSTVDTVRHYMNLSLLNPELKSNRYIFTQREERDFEVIVQLKQWGFTIKEIQSLFLYKRQSGCGTAKLLQYVHELLQSKQNSIEEKLELLSKQRQEVMENLREVQSLLAGAADGGSQR